MKRAVKVFAAVFCAVSFFLMAITGYYYYKLPDRFYVEKGSVLCIPAAFDIFAENSRLSESGSSVRTLSLKLFGMIPIKNVSAKSVEAPMVIPGGETFGVKLISDGVMVVDLQSGDCPAAKCGILTGDVIISINGEQVGTNREIAQIIRSSKGETLIVELKRNDEKMTVKLTPELADGSYRAGMWVRDSSAGIGTVTFYQPETGLFGGLGHPVCDSDTGKAVPIKEGVAAPVTIYGFNKSEPGCPGALLGSFSGGGSIGDIYSNSDCGIFGRLNSCPTDKETIPLGFRQDIKKGQAYIYSTIDGNGTEKYSVVIEEIDLSGSGTKNMVIRITDKRLLEKTGGILQGMSGSPIIQNGKLVGAVTHVFVNNTDMGYGVFADEMFTCAVQSAESETTALQKAA